MIVSPRSLILAAALALAGCAGGDGLEGTRTVFSNPNAAPVIDATGVGPQCDRARADDATCLGIPLGRKGEGARIGEQGIERLTRSQRRVLRERAELLRARTEELARTPPPPPPPPPTADPAGAAP